MNSFLSSKECGAEFKAFHDRQVDFLIHVLYSNPLEWDVTKEAVCGLKVLWKRYKIYFKAKQRAWQRARRQRKRDEYLRQAQEAMAAAAAAQAELSEDINEEDLTDEWDGTDAVTTITKHDFLQQELAELQSLMQFSAVEETSEDAHSQDQHGTYENVFLLGSLVFYTFLNMCFT